MDDSDGDTLTHDGQTLRDHASAPVDRALVVGGRYRVLDMIARGGMGEVYAARDEQVGRNVAIKRMREGKPHASALQRFLREARVQGRLEHPAIVPVHEIGEDADGKPYFVMKKLAGTTLGTLIEQDAPRHRLLRAFVDVCLAIEFAHVRGVVHRDLKPENIVLGDFGEVYVLDWGIAKVKDDPDGQLADIDTLPGSVDATRAGTMIGTPGYMAPEQIRGDKDLDGRADVYSLGCVLFQILTSTLLYPPSDEGLLQAGRGLVVRPSERAPDGSIPPELDAVCVAATTPDRNQRIATARTLGERVQRYLDGDRDLATRDRLARDQLERARGAFADGDRAEAMRGAASALALDPRLHDAAQLVGRLMIEPPATMPAEVEREIESDAIAARQRLARVAVYIYLVYVAFAGLIWWIGPAGSIWPLVLVGPMLLCVVSCWYGARFPTASQWRVGLLVVLNGVILAMISRMFGPIFIAPGLAAVTAMTLLIMPTDHPLGSALGVGIVLEVAVFVPWLLERLDVFSRTTFVTEHGVYIEGQLAGQEPRTLLVATLYSFGVIVIPCVVSGLRRAHERTAKRQAMLQAWQLRQLVPAR